MNNNRNPKADVRRKPWFLALARRYVRRRFRREFDGLHVEGLERVRDLTTREPIIVASTHVAWWDALLAIQMDWLLEAESYCLMDADNLRRLPFFGWVGAVPLDRGSPKQALRDMKAAATLLDRPGRVMWIFPQGRQRPAHLRPLDLQPGVRWLTRSSGVRVVPMALNYLYREAAKPAVIASFGEPIAGDGALMAELDAHLRAGLDRVDRFVERGEGGFEEQILGRSTDLPFAGRALSLLGGGGEQAEPEAEVTASSQRLHPTFATRNDP